MELAEEVSECGVCGSRFSNSELALCDECPLRQPGGSMAKVSQCCLLKRIASPHEKSRCKGGDREAMNSEMGLGLSEIARRYTPRDRVRNADTVDRLKKMAMGRSSIEPSVVIEKSVANIVTAMTRIHGGLWMVQIDHQTGFVVVMRHSP